MHDNMSNMPRKKQIVLLMARCAAGLSFQSLQPHRYALPEEKKTETIVFEGTWSTK
jgi:hypothetical protein